MDRVTVVYRNADRTEGKGPMVLDKIFSEHDDAVEYVETQGGIFGGPVKTDDSYSGWEIHTHDVVETLADIPEVMQAVERNRKIADAMAKLTPEERQLLGLAGLAQ